MRILQVRETPEAPTLKMQMSIATADIVNIMAGNSMNTAAATLVLKKVMAANHPLGETQRKEEYHYSSLFYVSLLSEKLFTCTQKLQGIFKALEN